MHEPYAICTLLVIAVTCILSYMAFSNRSLQERFIFCPRRILAGKEYHRLFTSAFLHADGQHLFFNMLSLFFFASTIELEYRPVQFLFIYAVSILGGSLLSLWLHRNHIYLALGASG